MNGTRPLATLLLAAGAHAAAAHAFLQTATPAVGSTVSHGPAMAVLAFTEGVEPLFSSITVTDATGHQMQAGPPHTVGDDQHLAIALLPLAPGTYRVTWHAVAVDTHKTEGSYVFTVSATATAPP